MTTNTNTTTASQPNAAPSERNAVLNEAIIACEKEQADFQRDEFFAQANGAIICKMAIQALKSAAPALPEPAAAQEPVAQQLAANALNQSAYGWKGCTLPPAGWYCTRVPAHDGPCAAWPHDEPAQPLAEVSAAQAVPEGFALVPVEPTPEMFKACDTVIQGYGAKLVYQRMLAAAPQPTDTTREA